MTTETQNAQEQNQLEVTRIVVSKDFRLMTLHVANGLVKTVRIPPRVFLPHEEGYAEWKKRQDEKQALRA